MKVYLVRHGIALDLGEQGILRDADRPLSERGMHRTREVAQAFARTEPAPDVIGSSPLVRADQTARIFHDVFGKQAPVESCPFMKPGGRAEHLVTWLQARDGDTSVMVVGHMPDLTFMTYDLLKSKPDHPLPFKKAGIASVAFDREPGLGRGELLWLKQPQDLLNE